LNDFKLHIWLKASGKEQIGALLIVECDCSKVILGQVKA
jgi:hypothetical protein